MNVTTICIGLKIKVATVGGLKHWKTESRGRGKWEKESEVGDGIVICLLAKFLLIGESQNKYKGKKTILRGLRNNQGAKIEKAVC